MPGVTAQLNGHNGGRPRGKVSSKTLRTQILRARLVARIEEKADRIFDAWEMAALGHWKQVKNPFTGEILRVYEKSPDPTAIKDMLEQAWGKPKQQIEIVEGDDEMDYDAEALQRMGKYVGPTDAEFTELIEDSPALVPTFKAVEFKPRATVYTLQRVGGGPSDNPPASQARLDPQDSPE